mmetsp:Transcript_14658/g.24403  ORF Transcript_14658/g.24403 Transcript_14658/m.24403 type:complete len:209 (+) Transcript_14658:485-1111(+)
MIILLILHKICYANKCIANCFDLEHIVFYRQSVELEIQAIKQVGYLIRSNSGRNVREPDNVAEKHRSHFNAICFTLATFQKGLGHMLWKNLMNQLLTIPLLVLCMELVANDFAGLNILRIKSLYTKVYLLEGWTFLGVGSKAFIHDLGDLRRASHRNWRALVDVLIDNQFQHLGRILSLIGVLARVELVQNDSKGIDVRLGGVGGLAT